MKILLYSNYSWTEKSFPFILKQLNRAKGLDFTTIDRVPAPLEVAPFVLQASGYKYPDWKWFYETLTKPYEDQYDLIAWHVERKEGTKYQFDAPNKLNGVYDAKTKDSVFNCFVSANNRATDERTKAHHVLYPGMTDFERVFIHEVSHGTSRFKGQDLTHVWDYEKHDIPGYFAITDVTNYKLQRTVISILQTIKGLYAQLLAKPKISDLHPMVKRQADKVVDEMQLLGHPIRIVEGYRSPERQTELYNQGRISPGNIVTNAKAGESFHQYGVAVDFVFIKEGYEASKSLWQTLGIIGKKHGFKWGGDWKNPDFPHLEMTLDYNLADFQKGLVDYSKYK